jgi:hypothetical protein
MSTKKPLLHIRYGGRSYDVPLRELDIGPASSDDQIRRAVAAYLEEPLSKLRLFVVERHDNGNVTIRPEAVFG